MRILLLLLCLVATGWLAKPYLMESPDEPPKASSPTQPSPRAATQSSRPQGARAGGPDIQALRDKIPTAPRLNWKPPQAVNQDPRVAFKPAVSPEEQAAVRARADEAQREMRERAAVHQEQRNREQKKLRRLEKKGFVVIPR